MDKKVAFLFPGQGAQYSGMGKDFFENFTIAKHVFESADDLLKYKLSQIIFEGPEELLKKTVNSQVAIFVVSVAILKVIEKEYPELRPSICAGLSLGEYTALFASGRIAFQDALRLVEKRAGYMNEACEKNSGTMAAVIGLDANIIEETLAKLNPPHLVWTANFNTDDQTVISGSKEGVLAASAVLQDIGAKRIIPLKVHGAFHSGLMKEAQQKLKPEILNTELASSEIDIIMNVCASAVLSSDDIKKYLILQMTNGVRWRQSIQDMEKKEVDVYIEIGPSKTLTAMNKKNKVKGLSFNIDKVGDLELLGDVVQ